MGQMFVGFSPAEHRWKARFFNTRCLVLVVAALTLVARKPWCFKMPQFWAEDGVFYAQAVEHGWRSVGMELAGYYHLAPRLIAAVASFLDPALAPGFFVICTALGTLGVAALALSRRLALPVPAICALSLVLAPDAGEVLLHAVNLQWIFCPGLVLLLLLPDGRNRGQEVRDCGTAALFSLSSPFCFALLPLFLGRAWVRRTGPSCRLAAVVGVCALLQAASILAHATVPPAGASLDWLALVSYPGIRLGGLLLGDAGSALKPSVSAVLLTFLTLGTLAWLGFYSGARQADRGQILIALGGLLAAILVRCWHSMPALCSPGGASRYVFPLQVMAVWLICFAVAAPRRLVARGALVLLGLAAFGVVARFRIPPIPDLDWPSHARRLRSGEAVTIPINPGWDLVFPARKSR